MDVSHIIYFQENRLKYENILRMQNILDNADANVLANIAVMAKKGKGYYVYRRWYKKIEKLIDKEKGVTRSQPTVWNRIGRKRKRKNNILN